VSKRTIFTRNEEASLCVIYTVAVLPLLFVAGWITYSFVADQAADSQRVKQDNEKVAYRRKAVEMHPDSAGAYESLGDALREADQYAEALSAFEAAKNLMEAGGGDGAGLIGGSGLENKIRLTRMDLEDAQRSTGSSYTERLASRESFCRQCGTLNSADAKKCVACGRDLPVNTIIETWQRDDIRRPILREFGQSVIMITIVVIALCIANWMPIEVKGVLLLSTIIVLTWKGLRAITDK